MKGNARDLPLTNTQKLQYTKTLGFTKKEKREIAADIFQDEIAKFMQAHQITVGEMYAAIGNCEQIPFTVKNVEKVCKALSKLAGVDFENSFNSLN